MKNKTKSTKEYEELLDIDETIKYIFKTKDKDVFNTEYNLLLEDLKSENFSKIKPFILTNFIQSKILQLNQQNEFIKDYLNNSVSDKFNLKINNDLSEEHILAKRCMMQKLNINISKCKDFINEDLNKLTFLNKKRNVDQQIVSNKDLNENDYISLKYGEKSVSIFDLLNNIQDQLMFESNTINIEKNDIQQERVDIIENLNTKNSQKLNIINYDNICDDINNLKKTDIKLKLTYADGSDSFPQYLNICLFECLDFEKFLIVLKKKLGIFEYARFKLIFMDENREKFFIKSINQFNFDKVNEVKIVPFDYQIK
jgi:hypothetical protein